MGFCLGCQLLGEIVGGKVIKSNPPEIGILDINMQDTIEEDNLFSGFPVVIKILYKQSSLIIVDDDYFAPQKVKKTARMS